MAEPSAVDRDEFRVWLRKAGRSESAADRCIEKLSELEEWLGKQPAEASPDDIDGLVSRSESAGREVKTHLWALAYLYDFVGDSKSAHHARMLRSLRVARPPLRLSSLETVEASLVRGLKLMGVITDEDLLTQASTADGVNSIAEQVDADKKEVRDLVLLVELMQIRGVGETRGRLYLNAVGGVREIAELTVEQLIATTAGWIVSSGFDGTPPTPKEAASTIQRALEIASTSSSNQVNPRRSQDCL